MFSNDKYIAYHTKFENFHAHKIYPKTTLRQICEILSPQKQHFTVLHKNCNPQNSPKNKSWQHWHIHAGQKTNQNGIELMTICCSYGITQDHK